MKNYLKEQREKAMRKRNEWVIKQVKKGRTRREVAKELGISEARVGQIIKGS